MDRPFNWIALPLNSPSPRLETFVDQTQKQPQIPQLHEQKDMIENEKGDEGEEEANETIYEKFDVNTGSQAKPDTPPPSNQTEEKDNRCRGDDSTKCPDSVVYICSDQFCDGVPDCPNGTDENDCPGENAVVPHSGCPITLRFVPKETQRFLCKYE